MELIQIFGASLLIVTLIVMVVGVIIKLKGETKE